MQNETLYENELKTRKVRKTVWAERTENKRVAAYARVSSDKDLAEQSLETQVRYYEDYIKHRNGWELAGIYADEGISGTQANRTAFQEMLEECRKGEIDIIITKSITRFARNTMLLLDTLRELKRLGVNVIFEKENIETASTAGELMLTILGTFAEEEAKSASQNQLWRIKRMFENGEVTAVRMLGYYTKDKTLEIIPEEAQVVRKIYDYYLQGMGAVKIAKMLEAEGITTIHNKRYDFRTVGQILANEKYKGDLLLQKTFSEDFRSKKRKANRGERNQYYVENAHEAIIDKDTWEAVQNERERRRIYTAPRYLEDYKPKTYLYTGLIYCEKCKKHFIRKKKNGKVYWACQTYMNVGKNRCDNALVPEDTLIQMTKEVIHRIAPTADCTNLTREMIKTYIDKITVPEHKRVVFYAKDGADIALNWDYPSRRESWTAEMKAKAREKAIENRRKGGR